MKRLLSLLERLVIAYEAQCLATVRNLNASTDSTLMHTQAAKDTWAGPQTTASAPVTPLRGL